MSLSWLVPVHAGSSQARGRFTLGRGPGDDLRSPVGISPHVGALGSDDLNGAAKRRLLAALLLSGSGHQAAERPVSTRQPP